LWSHEASVTIEASPPEVWKVLVDIDRYPLWNRYATSAVGELRVGGEVVINVPRQREKRGPVTNRVTELVVNQRLCWRSLSWYRFLVYGVRCRHLEAESDGSTVFREIEVMHGPLAGVIRRAMAPQLLRGLQTECDSLKQEVERANTSNP
jgi:uncharacterized protein YndB with AHSA1/START domain